MKEAPCPDCGSTAHRSCRTVPIIPTQWGPVSEVARKQAALNLARDPVLRQRMRQQFGEARLREQYPEVEWDELKEEEQ